MEIRGPIPASTTYVRSATVPRRGPRGRNEPLDSPSCRPATSRTTSRTTSHAQRSAREGSARQARHPALRPARHRQDPHGAPQRPGRVDLAVEIPYRRSLRAARCHGRPRVRRRGSGSRDSRAAVRLGGADACAPRVARPHRSCLRPRRGPSRSGRSGAVRVSVVPSPHGSSRSHPLTMIRRTCLSTPATLAAPSVIRWVPMATRVAVPRRTARPAPMTK